MRVPGDQLCVNVHVSPSGWDQRTVLTVTATLV